MWQKASCRQCTFGRLALERCDVLPPYESRAMYKFFYDHKYMSEDCQTLSYAHDMAPAILQTDNRVIYGDLDLGRTIMELFNDGIRDPKQIAIAAIDRHRA